MDVIPHANGMMAVIYSQADAHEIDARVREFTGKGYREVSREAPSVIHGDVDKPGAVYLAPPLAARSSETGPT
jgi:hypothetical protein